MPLIAAGISFRTAPVEVRERAALSDSEARHHLRFLLGGAQARVAEQESEVMASLGVREGGTRA